MRHVRWRWGWWWVGSINESVSWRRSHHLRSIMRCGPRMFAAIESLLSWFSGIRISLDTRIAWTRHICSLVPFWARNTIKFYNFSFCQGSESAAVFNRSMMNKDLPLRIIVVGKDEAVAFLTVEEFNSSRHSLSMRHRSSVC